MSPNAVRIALMLFILSMGILYYFERSRPRRRLHAAKRLVRFMGLRGDRGVEFPPQSSELFHDPDKCCVFEIKLLYNSDGGRYELWLYESYYNGTWTRYRLTTPAWYETAGRVARRIESIAKEYRRMDGATLIGATAWLSNCAKTEHSPVNA